MKAVYLPGNKRVEIRAIDVPTPGPGEVLVQVKASCICRSDLSLYYGNAVVGGDAAGKCVTGHEPSGVIAAAGAGVHQFKAGDRVAVYLGIGCGVCAACRLGDYFLCPQWRMPRLHRRRRQRRIPGGPRAQLLAHSGIDVLRRRRRLNRRVRHALQRLQEARSQRRKDARRLGARADGLQRRAGGQGARRNRRRVRPSRGPTQVRGRRSAPT